MRRSAAVVLGVTAAALLGACSAPVAGTPVAVPADQQRADRRAERAAAVDEALTALAGAGAVAYRISTGAGETVLNVTRNGTVHGTLPVGGHPVTLAEVDGDSYLSAPAPYWRTLNVGEAKAGEYAARWMRVDPSVLPVRPSATFAPAALVRALRDRLAAADQFAEPVRTRLPDGTEAFDVTVAGGRFTVTTAKPHRLVSLDAGLVGAGLGAAKLWPAVLAGEGVRQFQAALEGELGNLGQAFDFGADLAVTVEANAVTCTGAGVCTSDVRVRNTVDGASAVRIVVSALVTADGLGQRNCSQESSAAPNSTVTVACTVTFGAPSSPGQYRVVSSSTATGEAVVGLDVEALRGKIQSEFRAL
ncbi:hypothetical protein [Amycolatopsis suaedae]|uniref:Lipoprotein n=1 Tax=Amycolatopsis suaedae TaxID=2510978 RepID=A0A4Q7J8E7_9PSEU|nr:hypothetical protein [Amycolatopsis suaedae]RZQ63479.1 hypothetical protein EWH70_13675 [Amycolatopsis suaedae]